MDTATVANAIVEKLQHKVADINLADDGLKAIAIAEKEMPGPVSYTHLRAHET